MAKVIQQSKTNKNLLYAITTTIKTNGIKSAVHDGDTVNGIFDGHFGIRFLGGDTAEVALTLPGSGTEFPTPIKNPAWKPFLTNPFASQYGIFSRFELDGITKVEGDAESILGLNLIEYLRPKLGMSCSDNHSFHAEQAHRHLEDLIKVDVEECIQQQREYHFFLAFSAYSLTDRYGRLLAFVNRQDISTEDRKLSYNERMIRDGYSAPYFIWPNIDPFRSQHNRRAAVPLPNELQEWLTTGDGKIFRD
jgi:hypothetical protein